MKRGMEKDETGREKGEKEKGQKEKGGGEGRKGEGEARKGEGEGRKGTSLYPLDYVCAFDVHLQTENKFNNSCIKKDISLRNLLRLFSFIKIESDR